jgi:hypothetical protein
MNNNPPFFIGQKVVVLKRLFIARKRKGDTVFILKIIQCKCGRWLVDIGGKDKDGCLFDVTCYCSTVYDDNIMWIDSLFFAPIQENYSDATAEILEKFKQTTEVLDKVLVPEKTLMENPIN